MRSFDLLQKLLFVVRPNCTWKKTCHLFEPCDKMNKVVRDGSLCVPLAKFGL